MPIFSFFSDRIAAASQLSFISGSTFPILILAIVLPSQMGRNTYSFAFSDLIECLNATSLMAKLPAPVPYFLLHV